MHGFSLLFQFLFALPFGEQIVRLESRLRMFQTRKLPSTRLEIPRLEKKSHVLGSFFLNFSKEAAALRIAAGQVGWGRISARLVPVDLHHDLAPVVAEAAQRLPRVQRAHASRPRASLQSYTADTRARSA